MRNLALHLLVFIGFLRGPAVFAEGQTVWSRTAREAANFQVRSYQNGPRVAEVLARCILLRAEFQRLWHGAESTVPWQPRCEIVLHPSRPSYLHAVGRNGGQTSGSSLIRFENGRIRKRRIDLLVNDQGGLPALPHELTHVLLADRFGQRRPPRWVDEGIATMADSPGKRMRHHRDCEYALQSGSALRVIDLLSLEHFTSAQQLPAFYGQSLSLVHFFAAQDEPGRILDFAESAMDHGYDRALKEYYDIDGVAALELQWRAFAAAGPGNTKPSVVVSE